MDHFYNSSFLYLCKLSCLKNKKKYFRVESPTVVKLYRVFRIIRGRRWSIIKTGQINQHSKRNSIKSSIKCKIPWHRYITLLSQSLYVKTIIFVIVVILSLSYYTICLIWFLDISTIKSRIIQVLLGSSECFDYFK